MLAGVTVTVRLQGHIAAKAGWCIGLVLHVTGVLAKVFCEYHKGPKPGGKSGRCQQEFMNGGTLPFSMQNVVTLSSVFMRLILCMGKLY